MSAPYPKKVPPLRAKRSTTPRIGEEKYRRGVFLGWSSEEKKISNQNAQIITFVIAWCFCGPDLHGGWELSSV